LPERFEIYKCAVCNNIVEILKGGPGKLSCCGETMKLMQEKTEDQGQEKHVPVIENNENGLKVKVGSVPHPMEDNHYIEWVEVISDGKVYKKFLKPGENAEAEFEISVKNLEAREMCNIHGLWKSS
jgi:superoxide reductase